MGTMVTSPISILRVLAAALSCLFLCTTNEARAEPPRSPGIYDIPGEELSEWLVQRGWADWAKIGPEANAALDIIDNYLQMPGFFGFFASSYNAPAAHANVLRKHFIDPFNREILEIANNPSERYTLEKILRDHKITIEQFRNLEIPADARRFLVASSKPYYLVKNRQSGDLYRFVLSDYFLRSHELGHLTGDIWRDFKGLPPLSGPREEIRVLSGHLKNPRRRAPMTLDDMLLSKIYLRDNLEAEAAQRIAKLAPSIKASPDAMVQTPRDVVPSNRSFFRGQMHSDLKSKFYRSIRPTPEGIAIWLVTRDKAMTRTLDIITDAALRNDPEYISFTAPVPGNIKVRINQPLRTISSAPGAISTSILDAGSQIPYVGDTISWIRGNCRSALDWIDQNTTWDSNPVIHYPCAGMQR